MFLFEEILEFTSRVTSFFSSSHAKHCLALLNKFVPSCYRPQGIMFNVKPQKNVTGISIHGAEQLNLIVLSKKVTCDAFESLTLFDKRAFPRSTAALVTRRLTPSGVGSVCAIGPAHTGGKVPHQRADDASLPDREFQSRSSSEIKV